MRVKLPPGPLTQVRCLGPGSIKREHWFGSPDPKGIRICAKCRQLLLVTFSLPALETGYVESFQGAEY